jgi:hypothetical protein
MLWATLCSAVDRDGIGLPRQDKRECFREASPESIGHHRIGW